GGLPVTAVCGRVDEHSILPAPKDVAVPQVTVDTGGWFGGTRQVGHGVDDTFDGPAVGGGERPLVEGTAQVGAQPLLGVKTRPLLGRGVVQGQGADVSGPGGAEPVRTCQVEPRQVTAESFGGGGGG